MKNSNNSNINLKLNSNNEKSMIERMRCRMTGRKEKKKFTQFNQYMSLSIYTKDFSIRDVIIKKEEK